MRACFRFLILSACLTSCALFAEERPTGCGEVGSCPAYYAEHLRDVAKRVCALAPSCADGFWFLTDLHIKSNRRRSGRLIAELSRLTSLNRVLCGGDLVEAFGKGYPTDRDGIDFAIDAYLEDWVRPLRAAGCRLYTAKGNHDFTICHSYSTPEDKKRGYTYGGEKAREVIVGASTERDIRSNPQDLTACYYYADNVAAKVRYVVADTTDTETAGDRPWAVHDGMHAPQLKWLAHEAFGTVPADFGVIVMHHIPVTGVVGSDRDARTFAPMRELLEAYQNRGTFACDGETFDFTAAKGRIVLDLTGHHHCEMQTFQKGIWHVTSPCDAAYADYIDRSKPWCGDLPKKAAGTVAEQTFDAVQFDRERRLVHFTRVGGGQNRTIHLEVRKARVGEGLKLAPKFLDGPVTWGCYDADAVTNRRHPTNPYCMTVQYHNERAVMMPEGMLCPTKAGEVVVIAMDKAFNKEIFPVVIQ